MTNGNTYNAQSTDYSFLTPNGFRMVIDSQKYPHAQYTVQTTSIPGISNQSVQTGTQKQTLPMAGASIQFEPLTLTFLIDERLINYLEIYEWLLDNYKSDQNVERDISLMVLTSHNNPSKELRFAGAFPVSLSGMEFSVMNQSVEYMTASATFDYSYFEIV